MIQDTLPDKPSDLLELALKDLLKAEQDENLEIDMQYWHFPREGKCLVCLAGACLHYEYNLNPNQSFIRLEIPNSVNVKLSALNILRLGKVHTALRLLGRDTKVNGIIPTQYNENRNLFIQQMEELVVKLRKEGN